MVTAPDRLLRRLEWRLGRRLDGRLQGAYRTVWRGSGIDFTDLRAYTPEDDVRHIDWNVTARLDEPCVRQYTEDRELTAWLVVDRSASMRFGRSRSSGGSPGSGRGRAGGGQGKEAVATELAVSLSRLVAQGGNRVGAILYDNRAHQVIPPRTGRDQVLRIARELMRPQTPARSGHDHRPGRDAAPGRLHHRAPPQPGLRDVRLHRRPGLGSSAGHAHPPP